MEPKYFFTTIIFSISFTACSPIIDNRGFETDNVDFTQIQAGVQNTDQVLAVLGSPSTVSPFPPQTWYYVSKVTETKSFLKPKTLEQQIIAITFDENGIVKSITESKGENTKDIKIVKRETATAGYKSGVLREVFSNFGKIASKGTPGQH